MCNVIEDVSYRRIALEAFKREKDVPMVGESAPALPYSTGTFACLFSAPGEGTEGCGGDGAALLTGAKAQESPSSSTNDESIGYVQEAKPFIPLQEVWPLGKQSQKQQQEYGWPTATDPMSALWSHYELFASHTTADIDPSLFTAFLLYRDEIFMSAKGETMMQKQGQEGLLECYPCNEALNFIRMRLFPSGNFPAPQILESGLQNRKADAAFSWFLQHHRELAATAMSMGFSFLLGLEEYKFSWRKAVEVPITALQLLANYAHTLTFGNDEISYDTFGPREHLLIMAACVLACWKYAEVDANVAVLHSVLEKSFFRHHHVLNTKEIAQLECVVLGVCGFFVEAPRWWKVAMSLLFASYSEEEEEHNSDEHLSLYWQAEIQNRYEGRLEQLLLTTERVLLFVMRVSAATEEETERREKREGEESKTELYNPSSSTNRICELRGWIDTSPLFGVALAVGSGAVALEWTVAQIGPTAHQPLSLAASRDTVKKRKTSEDCSVFPSLYHLRGVICNADAVAHREIYRMVAILSEVLQLSPKTKSDNTY